MISLEKNFLFVHIPKTGGNSIQNILDKYSEDTKITQHNGQDGVNRFGVKSNISADLKKHSSLREYKTALGSTLYQRLFKFSVVRNPWERAISFYFSPHRRQEVWDKKLFVKAVDDLSGVSHYISVSDMTKSSQEGGDKLGSELDFVIRYEKLREDFEKVSDFLSIEKEPLLHVNKSKRKPFREYYDNELIELIGSKFADEIAAFGHTFE